MIPPMIWAIFPAIALLAVCAASVRFMSRLRRLGRVARQLAAGEPPEGFLAYDGGLLGELSWRLQQIAERQANLRRQIIEEEFAHRTILSAVVEGVMVVDRARVVRLANGACLSLFGIKTEPIGQTGLSVLHDASIEKIVTAVLASGKAQSREIDLSRQPAERRHFEMIALPMKNMAGEIRGVIFVFRNLARLGKVAQHARELVMSSPPAPSRIESTPWPEMIELTHS
jgi:PAS domain-containing protein